MSIDFSKLVQSMGVPTDASLTSLRIFRLENLFRNHQSIMIVPIVRPLLSLYYQYQYYITARDSPSQAASCILEGVDRDVAYGAGNMRFDRGSSNYGRLIDFASIFTFLGLDVYMFYSHDDGKTVAEACIELFDPTKLPRSLFIMTAAHYFSLFGILLEES